MKFDEFMKFLADECGESWKIPMQKVLRSPSILSCLRYHYERNRIARMAIQANMKKFAVLIQSQLNTDPCSDEFCKYMYDIIEQMAQYTDKTKSIADMFELATAAAEVTGENAAVLMALIGIASVHPSVKDAGRTAVCACAAKFTSQNMVVVVGS